MEDKQASSIGLGGIDLSELDLAPSWVNRQSDSTNQITWSISEASPKGRGGDRRGPRGERREKKFERQGRGENRPPRAEGGFQRREGSFQRREGERHDNAFGDRRPPRPGGQTRPAFDRSGHRGSAERRPARDNRGPRREDGERPERGGQQGRRSGAGRRPERGARTEREQNFTPPLAGWKMSIIPQKEMVDSLATQIKGTGIAYPIFEVARLFLSNRNRYVLHFSPQDPKAPSTPLIRCALDGSLWVNREEARRHLESSGLLNKFFRAEKVTVDPPKGTFTSVAVCGMSGEILGPPTIHTYQTNLARLHRERFSHVPFDRYRARVKIEKDEAKVQQWLESMTQQTHYVLRTDSDQAPTSNNQTAAPVVAPTIPETSAQPPSENPLVEDTAAASIETDSAATPPPTEPTEAVAASTDLAPEVAAEVSPEAPAESADASSAPAAASSQAIVFKTQTEALNYILKEKEAELFSEVTEARVPGHIPGRLLTPGLLSLLRQVMDEQKRFPLLFVQELSRCFESVGLRFFKEQKKETYVSRSRPRALDPAIPVSERVQALVDYISAHPFCSPAEVITALKPHRVRDDEGRYLAPGSGFTLWMEKPKAPLRDGEGRLIVAGPGFTLWIPRPTSAPTTPTQVSEDQVPFLTDLRWLVREGFVTEFYKGGLRVVTRQEPPPEKKAAAEKSSRLLDLPGHGFTLWLPATS